MSKPLRVLVAKPGLDGHDRGAHLIAHSLRNAGMEVIYGGIRQTPAMIAHTAVDEDVSLVGLSILAGGHLGLSRRVLAALAEVDASDIPVVVGGVIPDEDIPVLLEMGIAAVFPSSTMLADIVERVRAAATRSVV